jgi:hypothetical protein
VQKVPSASTGRPTAHSMPRDKRRPSRGCATSQIASSSAPSVSEAVASCGSDRPPEATVRLLATWSCGSAALCVRRVAVAWRHWRSGHRREDGPRGCSRPSEQPPRSGPGRPAGAFSASKRPPRSDVPSSSAKCTSTEGHSLLSRHRRGMIAKVTRVERADPAVGYRPEDERSSLTFATAIPPSCPTLAGAASLSGWTLADSHKLHNLTKKNET